MPVYGEVYFPSEKRLEDMNKKKIAEKCESAVKRLEKTALCFQKISFPKQPMLRKFSLGNWKNDI